MLGRSNISEVRRYPVPDTHDISSSLEDYIEAIYVISNKNKVARVTDISNRLQVARSSVSGALKTLSSMDMVNYTPYRYVTLTEKGEKLGREMHSRHNTIRSFFVRVLGVDDDKADSAACQMEHSVDREILDKLTRLIDFIDSCPRIGADLIRNHLSNCDLQEPDSRCATCIRACLDSFETENAS
jgi:DtxR family Mn-dependent transcriptional regulator